MTWQRFGRTLRGVMGLAAAAPVAILLVWLLAGRPATRAGDGTREAGLDWREVRRMDLETNLVAGGDLQARKETTVTCEVEDITESEGVTIISVIENGRPVKKGDELCRLDASELDEIARKQEILVGQARSSSVQARLQHETAELAPREFGDGLVVQQTKEYEGRIALQRSDAQKLKDHLEWTERMAAKGYASQAQLVSERQSLAEIEHQLRKTQGEFELFRKYQVNKEITSLQGQVSIAEHNEQLESARLRSEEEELAYIRKQIDRCVIRAPQDGVVVYSMRGFWRRTMLQPGVRVYENQEIFKIPDLSCMEVDVSVNESFGPRVKVGMKADIEVASIAGRIMPGKVVSVALLSTENDKEWDERIRHFLVRVRFDATPPRLLPFMSAVVSIDTGSVLDALVVPVAAVTTSGGRTFCSVLGPRGPERRPVTIRNATPNLVEVIDGLEEGDRILIDPATPAPA